MLSICRRYNVAMSNCRAIIEAYRPAFDVAYEELLNNDVLSGERLEEIIAANPPLHTDYPKVGPDTPCKVLLSEAEEEKKGRRVIADPAEKKKYAIENYYPQVKYDPPHLRDRLNGKPYGKNWEDVTLADYSPQLRIPQAVRHRDIPKWGDASERKSYDPAVIESSWI